MRQIFGAIKRALCVVAPFLWGAIMLISCKESIETIGALSSTDSLSTQTVHDMVAIETTFGRLSGRLEAPLMESFSLLPEPYEIFPKGLRAMSFTPEGELETEITAKEVVHKTKSDHESWEAYGNVVVTNHIKKETLTTDTLYWDRVNQRIYTHAFVKMVSPQGMMQGFGMESDERAYNVSILRPFDSYGVLTRDTVSRASAPVDSLMSPVDSLVSPVDSLP